MFEFNFRLFFLLEAYFSGRVRPVGRGTGRQTLLDSTSGCTDSEAVSHKKSGKEVEADVRVKNAWAAFYAHRNVWRCKKNNDATYTGLP